MLDNFLFLVLHMSMTPCNNHLIQKIKTSANSSVKVKRHLLQHRTKLSRVLPLHTDFIVTFFREKT